MDWTDLEQRIGERENLRTEFNLEAVNADDLAAALVAFANADGGHLILGVANDRTVAGVRDPDKVRQYVDNVAVNNCVPPVSVDQATLSGGSAQVVVITIPRGEQRPHRTNRGIYYVRTGSGRRSASREELLRMFQGVESLYYDETSFTRLDAGVLDLEAVKQFVEKTGQIESTADVDLLRLLASWRLVKGGHPTLAGIVLFGRNPQEHLPFAQINAARIPGIEIANEPSDRKDLGGRLLDVVDQAMRFLTLHLPIRHEIRGLEPEPRPELPDVALREALVNAVAHRDYTIQGPVRLFVFDDRVEFHSPGKAPNTLDEAAMRSGAHVVRNPHLYARLSDAGLVTRAGSGIPRLVRAVKQATGRDVSFRLTDSQVTLSIPRKLQP
jgi:ATP-dependent DNA helicase RecG